MITISAACARARWQAVVDFLAPTATLHVYSGTRPGAVADEPTADAVLLVELPLTAALADDGITLNGDPQGALIADNGTATWARLLTADGTPALDLDISAESGAGDIRLAGADTRLYRGGAFTLTAALLR